MPRSPVTFPLLGGTVPELARGKFLVASGRLRDTNFSKTVVLLVDYNRDGAMGLVINRPTEVKLSRALPQLEALKQRPDIVYLGGPVAAGRVWMLVRSGRQPERSRRVFGDVHISSSLGLLRQIIEAEGERFRVYAGHVGWAPGQLDREVASGGWHVLEANTETIFDKVAAEIWPELIFWNSLQDRQASVPVS